MAALWLEGRASVLHFVQPDEPWPGPVVGLAKHLPESTPAWVTEVPIDRLPPVSSHNQQLLEMLKGAGGTAPSSHHHRTIPEPFVSCFDTVLSNCGTVRRVVHHNITTPEYANPTTSFVIASIQHLISVCFPDGKIICGVSCALPKVGHKEFDSLLTVTSAASVTQILLVHEWIVSDQSGHAVHPGMEPIIPVPGDRPESEAHSSNRPVPRRYTASEFADSDFRLSSRTGGRDSERSKNTETDSGTEAPISPFAQYHVVEQDEKESSCQIVLLCADFIDRIFGVMASALHQRRALGILEPVVGLAFTRTSSHICVLLGWLADGEDGEFELPRVHVAVPRAPEGPTSPSAIFDLCDPSDVFCLGTYLLSLEQHVASIWAACSSLQELPTRSDDEGYCWRAETIGRGESSAHFDGVPIDSWAQEVSRSSSDTFISGIHPPPHSTSPSTFMAPKHGPQDREMTKPKTTSPPAQGQSQTQRASAKGSDKTKKSVTLPPETQSQVTPDKMDKISAGKKSGTHMSASAFAYESLTGTKNLFWHVGRASLPYSIDPVNSAEPIPAKCDSGPTLSHLCAYKEFTGPSYPHLIWDHVSKVPVVHDSSLEGLRQALSKGAIERNRLLEGGTNNYRLPPLLATSSDDLSRDFGEVDDYLSRILSISRMAGGYYETESRRAFDNMIELCFESPEDGCKAILERELNFAANTAVEMKKGTETSDRFEEWLKDLVEAHRRLSGYEEGVLSKAIKTNQTTALEEIRKKWQAEHPSRAYKKPSTSKDEHKAVNEWVDKTEPSARKPEYLDWGYRLVRHHQRMDILDADEIAVADVRRNALDTFLEAVNKEPTKGRCDAICVASFQVEGEASEPSEGFNLLRMSISQSEHNSRSEPRFSKSQYMAEGKIRRGDTFVSSYFVTHRPWIQHFVPLKRTATKAIFISPKKQQTSTTSDVDALIPQFEALEIKDRNPDRSTLDLPLLIAEYKKPSEGSGYSPKGGNQDRMYLVSAVKYLEALGITDFPVFGMITEGSRASIISAMLTTTKDGNKLQFPYIERLEHDVRNYNLEDPLDAFELAHFIRKLVRYHVPALGHKLRLAAGKWPDSGLAGLKPWSMEGIQPSAKSKGKAKEGDVDVDEQDVEDDD